MSSLVMSGAPVQNATRRQVLSGLVAASVLAGCGGADRETSSNGRTRPFRHLMGTTDVPVAPRRVAMTYQGAPLDTAVLLGVPVVAAGHSPQMRAQIADVGWLEPSFEALAGARPDLIVCDNDEGVYRRCSAIAPTVVPILQNDRVWPTPWTWAEQLAELGDLYGEPVELDAGIRAVRGRVTELGERLGAKRDRLTVSVLRMQADGEASIYPGAARHHNAIMEAAGIRRPANQAYTPTGKNLAYSPERILQLDADVLLLWGRSEGAEGSADFDRVYRANPLWGRLAAVRAGQVYEVTDAAWNETHSLQAAQVIVDDLTRFLVDATPVRT